MNFTRKTIIGLLLISGMALSQTGKELFEQKNYRGAIPKLNVSAQTDPQDYWYLAKCDIAIGDFDNAVEALQMYKTKYSGADQANVNALIAILDRDDDLVKMENLVTINTAQADLFPRISQDGKTLYFSTTDRSGGFGGEDMWMSRRQPDASWSTPVNMGSSLNTSTHEDLFSISGDGNVAILFGNYQGSFGNGDLFYTVRKGNRWSMPCNLGGTVNSGAWESMANLGPDGKTLFFVSGRTEGAIGDEDIWVTTLTESGWTTPKNLGAVINTPQKEKYPFLSADGKTLYFSSNGHPGLGGQDIFVSRRNGPSWTDWSKPVNLGKYINTIEDDQDLTIPASGVRGYIVKRNMPDGKGSTDIYSFVLPYEMRPEPVFQVYGTVQDETGSPVAAIIRYRDLDSGEDVASATSNKSNGMYHVSLPAYKRYNITIDMKGYLYYSDLLDLTDPDKLLTKQSINELLAGEKTNLDNAHTRFSEYNDALAKQLASNSNDLVKAFGDYQKLARQFRENSRNLDTYIKRAKMEWLSKEDDQRELRRDYTLQHIKIGAKLELKNIYFDFGKATLRSDSKQALNELYDLLNRAQISIEIGGHTDNVGGEQTNLALSQARVDEVKKYLVDKGISPSRVTAVGYGERFPIASNDTDEGRQKNRRVELKVTGMQQREGKDEVEEEIKYDMLALLRHAADIGGLPDDSPCKDNAVFYSENETAPVQIYKEEEKMADINLDNNVYGGYNAHLLNFGFANVDDGLLGVGITTVDESLREYHLEYYFSTPESINLMARLAAIWMYPLKDITGLNLNVQYGGDFRLWTIDYQDEQDQPATKAQYFLNIPLGVRYLFEYSGVNLGADAVYHINVLESSEPYELESASYLQLGINSRYGMLQGGLFFNNGDLVDYLGFRAGVAF